MSQRRADFSFSNIDITSRPKANEFPILIKTRTRTIPYFKWRMEMKNTTKNTWLSHEMDNILRLAVLHIALKIGRMRSRFYIWIRHMMRSSTRSDQFRMEIDMNMVDAISTGVTSYLKYHTQDHAEFNFRGGYKNPTTPNTVPINRVQVAQDIELSGKELLIKNFRLNGLIL